MVMLQKVLRSLEVASEVLEELSRLAEADKEAVRQKCQEFLQNLQVGASHTPLQCSPLQSEGLHSV